MSPYNCTKPIFIRNAVRLKHVGILLAGLGCAGLPAMAENSNKEDSNKEDWRLSVHTDENAVPSLLDGDLYGNDYIPSDIKLDYRFYVGGLSVAELSIGTTFSGANYTSVSQMQTRGIFDVLINGSIDAVASGVLRQNTLDPGTFSVNSSSRSGKREVSMRFKNATPVNLQALPPFEEEEDVIPVADYYKQGVLDPVTATAAVFYPRANDGICNRTIPVFDGKRRYDIILIDPDKVEGGRASSVEPPEWSSPLIYCAGFYERIAGFPQEMLEEHKYFAFDVWFEQPENGISRAIKIAGKTRFGHAIGKLIVDGTRDGG